ncbi:hypothetical protein [Micromonospora sp. WMMD812]|uniref:hypothetical protein n=1 Tax=Micromonospora sp. WMMD812 TaxID=3015152 RepID=UPI00248AEF2A|nr:hypothetical protein [Micromonospora sp. WMMD812]WBB70781.1 hypothetical protein O7603_16085 [Micromonospora sp. WMMD812]
MGPYLKAVWSAVASGIIAFLSSLLTALQGENTGWETITAGQWVTAVLAFVVAASGTGAVTYRVPNRSRARSVTTPTPLADPPRTA